VLPKGAYRPDPDPFSSFFVILAWYPDRIIWRGGGEQVNCECAAADALSRA
jgi:hypothetical protein